MASWNLFEELMEAAEERSSLESSRRPHGAPLVPSSGVPPSLSLNGASEGDENWEDMILWTFDEAAMKRYEACRRSGLGNSEMNRMMEKIIGKDVSKEIKLVLSGAGKLYTGYLVETALKIMSERNDTGPIRPEYIAESYRRLIHEGRIFDSSSGRDRYLNALSSAQIFESLSAPQPFNTHDSVMQPKL